MMALESSDSIYRIFEIVSGIVLILLCTSFLFIIVHIVLTACGLIIDAYNYLFKTPKTLATKGTLTMPRTTNTLFLDGYKELIQAVKQRRELYCKYHPQFGDKRHKLQLWHEVCRELVPDWDRLSAGEKGEKLNEVQRGWKTVRDGFNRHLSFQKQDEVRRQHGEEVRRRKTYGYYNELKFLLKNKGAEFDIEGLDPLDPFQNDDSDNSSSGGETFNPIIVKKHEIEQRKKVKTEPSLDTEPQDDKESKVKHLTAEFERDEEQVIDEDKHFCLSLVPSFREMTAKQKFDARIAILQVIGDIRFRSENCDVVGMPVPTTSSFSPPPPVPGSISVKPLNVYEPVM